MYRSVSEAYAHAAHATHANQNIPNNSKLLFEQSTI